MNNERISPRQWLHQLIDAFGSAFFDGENAPKLPEIHAFCAYPKSHPQAAGECEYIARAFKIVVHPEITDPVRIAEILLHECIHAAVGLKEGHRDKFKLYATKLGLEGPMTESYAGEALKKKLRGMVEKIGHYPAKKITPAEKQLRDDVVMLITLVHRRQIRSRPLP